MRRTLLTAFVCASIAIAAFSQELASPQPAPEKDPFVGLWRANRDKSHPRLGKTDASYVRLITRDGEDLVFRSQTRRSDANDYKIRCDGRPHVVPFGILSCKYAAPNMVEGETKSAEAHRILGPRGIC